MSRAPLAARRVGRADAGATPLPHASDELRAHVLRGLAATPRELSPKYFYDNAGAALFERICELDEYYLTRVESAIHGRYAREIASCIGPGARLVEFGSGNGVKTRRLLAALQQPAAYVPVDVCRPQLEAMASDVGREFPGVQVTPVCADFASVDVLPAAPRGVARTVALCHGSTIGNLHPAEAQAFLSGTARLCGAGAGMLVGVDLAKDPRLIERAYNDAAGVTAAFNLNLLRRINRECGADFDPAAFEHLAVYDDEQLRVEMRLVSARGQVVTVPVADGAAEAARFELRAGEWITTEYSYKPTERAFEALVELSGWMVETAWMDERRWFGVWMLRRTASGTREVAE